MTTESTELQSELGPVPANGQGQSQGHRRRRRRRKNKSSQASAVQVQQPQPQPQEQVQPQPQPTQQKAAPARQSGRQGGRPGGRQNQNQGRKKKFFQKGPAAPQPGNSISGPPQNKRRGRQQKGPREFVGPMDHSYRTVNGNIADGPLSTIQIMQNGGHNGGYYPRLPSARTPPPASTASSRTCSSWPRSRRRPASWA